MQPPESEKARRPRPKRRSDYIHGTAPEEQRRLTVLNQLLNRSSLAELGLSGGERVLDVGSGLAQFTRAMARAAGPSGYVLGIERSEDQIIEGLRQARADGEEELIQLRVGDAFKLPLRDDEKKSFDVVHARFVLEHVPDPLRVVQEMMRAAKPGGRLVLEDDDHEMLRLYPEPPGFAPLWRAYMRSYERNGNDPYVGRHLVWLLAQAGARPKRNTWIFFGGCSGDPHFTMLIENAIGLLEGAREPMLKTGELETKSAFDAAIRAFREWGTRNDAAIWFARCWAEGLRPG